MKFAHYGKSYHLVVRSAHDLPDVLALDDSHWAVTSAPTRAFKSDAKFITYLDSDANGRIRTEEVRIAVQWCLDTLADTSAMDKTIESIDLSAIRQDSADGAALLVTAGYVAEQMGSSAATVTLAQVRQCMDELRMKPLNGDGVIVPEAATQPSVAEYLSAAIDATGGDIDLSEKIGIGTDKLAAFKADIADFIVWREKGDQAGIDVMPFGADTQAVWILLQSAAPRIDHFFMLAGFQKFDPTVAEKFLSANADAATADDALYVAPLAIPDEAGRLPLSGPTLNPVYKDEIATFRDDLFARVLGRTPQSLTVEDWITVKAALAPYGAYLADKKGGSVDTLPLDTLRTWRDGSFHDEAMKLVEADQDVARRVAAFSQLEKLILYHAHLLNFIHNFVSLSEFYAPDARSLFESGSAVIDGRWFNFAIETADPAAHSTVAKASGIFTLYLKVECANDPAKDFTVAVPATSGTRGNLSVGKRGIFFDIHGVQHDAVITQIIENPISLLEAVLSPFAKIGKMAMGKIEGLSTSAEESLMQRADTATTAALTSTSTPVAPPAAPVSPATLLMSISISIAALGSGFAVLSKSFGTMSIRGRIYAALIGAFVVLFPIVLGGLIKLARQDLSAILEGCGWAVNQRMRLTNRLRRQFTERKPYPEGAEGTPGKLWLKTLTVLLFIAAIVAALIWEWKLFS